MLNADKELAKLKQQHLLRTRQQVAARENAYIILGGERLIDFAGNDYLQLSQDARVKQAFSAAASHYGLGSTASAMIAGYTDAHAELEQAAASFLNRPRAIVFNSGYHANLAVLQALGKRHTYIVADKACHASLLDGARLSYAKLTRFAHQNLSQASTLLHPSDLLVTESVFSMTGEVTAMDKLVAIADASKTTLVVDDAHGIGVLGEKGKGVCDAFNLSCKELPVLITPLGKAIGSMGAIVSGSDDVIDYILQHARTYFYSTALPAAICVASTEAFNVLTQESWRTVNLTELCAHFNERCAQAGLTLLSTDLTPINTILLADNEKTLRVQQQLKQHGFYVGAIRPPTVAANSARLRITLNIAQSRTDIDELIKWVAYYVNT